jgi:hypothetical protein
MCALHGYLGVWFFKRAAHPRQGILITHERKASTLYFAPVDRLNPIRARIQLDEIVIPHDVENWQSSALEQVCQEARLVPLCFLRRGESIQTTEEITGCDNRLDCVFPSDSQ